MTDFMHFLHLFATYTVVALGGGFMFAIALWVLGQGITFEAPDDNVDDLTDDEYAIVGEERLRELTDRAIELTRPSWPERPTRRAS